MPGDVGMFAGVSIWGAIAAESGAALLAGAEMDPGGPGLDALLTFKLPRAFDRDDKIDMGATVFRWIHGVWGKSELKHTITRLWCRRPSGH